MPEHLTWAAAEAIVEASPLFAAERRSARHGGTRDSRSSSSQGAHWLTVLVRAGKCGLCDRGLRAGRDAVYRHKPQELLCVACADKAGLFYRPSLRWERERKRPSQLKLTAPPKPKRSKQPKASGWRAAREWMSDEEWATTREAMGKKAA